VLGHQLRISLDRQVESAERRAAVPRDQRRGANPAALVRAVLIQRQPDQGLDARQEDGAGLLAVFGVERKCIVDGHALLRKPS
jgi:hypothetical protein